MDNLNDAALYLGEGAGSAITVGLVEGVKHLFPKVDWGRFAPLLALVLAAGWNALVLANLGMPVSPVRVAFLAVITGLSASGLFSGTKAVAGK